MQSQGKRKTIEIFKKQYIEQMMRKLQHKDKRKDGESKEEMLKRRIDLLDDLGQEYNSLMKKEMNQSRIEALQEVIREINLKKFGLQIREIDWRIHNEHNHMRKHELNKQREKIRMLMLREEFDGDNNVERFTSY